MKQIMKLRLIVLGLVFSMSFSSALAQQLQDFSPYYKYRIYLKDKKNNEYSIKHPEEFLSQKAIERRHRQHLKINVSDLPVNRSYLNQISTFTVTIVETSKWNNTVVISTMDTSCIAQIKALPCVKDVVKVATYSAPRKVNNVDRHSLIASAKKDVSATEPTESVEPQKNDTLILDYSQKMPEDYLPRFIKYLNAQQKPALPASDVAESKPYSYYGDGTEQIEQLNGTALHYAGYKGDGMTVAIIDGGFYNADIISGLSKAKILGVRDFVEPGSDIYDKQDHGMMVLSCIAANVPGEFVGTAPEASFWLLRSEDGDTEQMIEEDNWCAAIEFADSVGVDVINTSLGYNDFDDKSTSVKYCELDGHSQIISNSASMCADKGMILVNSAGNSGDNVWKLITSPADSEHTLTVGAVDKNGVNTQFSSIGFTTDGRIKPDVMARGGASTVYGDDGSVTKASGTSFSSPITCGMVTCLWQALPKLTAHQIIDVVRMSGNNASHPDNIMGYGIPDYEKAWKHGMNIR